MKRILSIILSMSIVISLFAMAGGNGAVAEGVKYTKDDIGYIEDEDGIIINNYIGDQAEVKIPATIEGKEVYRISADAFCGKTSLKKIVIPDSVKRIDECVFRDCTALKDIEIGENVEEIGYSAFENTAYYNDEKNWENGILYIDAYLIKVIGVEYSKIENYGMSNLGYEFLFKKITGEKREVATDASHITVKDGTRVVAYGAFAFLDSLVKLNLPNSIKYINDYAFFGCMRLQDVAVSDAAFSMGNCAFECCLALTNFDGGKALKIGEAGFYNCSGLENFSTVINAESISDFAFYNCSKLTEVNVGKKVKEIGVRAFLNCKKLCKFSFPSELTYIGSEAFRNCKSLKSAVIPDNVERIGTIAFRNCAKLKKVTLGKKIQTIEMGTFRDCKALGSVKFRGKVKTIRKNAFLNCNIKEINLRNAEKVYKYAFMNCPLKKVKFGKKIIVIGVKALYRSKCRLHIYYKGTKKQWKKKFKKVKIGKVKMHYKK